MAVHACGKKWMLNLEVGSCVWGKRGKRGLKPPKGGLKPPFGGFAAASPRPFVPILELMLLLHFSFFALLPLPHFSYMLIIRFHHHLSFYNSSRFPPKSRLSEGPIFEEVEGGEIEGKKKFFFLRQNRILPSKKEGWAKFARFLFHVWKILLPTYFPTENLPLHPTSNHN